MINVVRKKDNTPALVIDGADLAELLVYIDNLSHEPDQPPNRKRLFESIVNAVDRGGALAVGDAVEVSHCGSIYVGEIVRIDEQGRSDVRLDDSGRMLYRCAPGSVTRNEGGT